MARTTKLKINIKQTHFHKLLKEKKEVIFFITGTLKCM